MANLRGVGTRLSGSAGDWTYTENGGTSVAKQNNHTLCPAMIVNFSEGDFSRSAVRQPVLNLSKLARTCRKLVEHGVFQPQNLLKLVETCFFGPVRSFCVILHLEIESLTTKKSTTMTTTPNIDTKSQMQGSIAANTVYTVLPNQQPSTHLISANCATSHRENAHPLITDWTIMPIMPNKPFSQISTMHYRHTTAGCAPGRYRCRGL